MSQIHRRWTKEEEKKLKELARKYPTVAEISRILDRPASSIVEKAKNLGISFIKTHGKKKKKDEELVIEYKEMGDGEKRGFSKTTDKLILQFLSEGYSYVQIAVSLHRDYETLLEYCNSHKNRFKLAHVDMMEYNGIYALRLKKLREKNKEYKELLEEDIERSIKDSIKDSINNNIEDSNMEEKFAGKK